MKDQIKVLILDDNPKFLETIKPVFESKNCLVECTSDKQKALSLLLNNIFHIIFIDCVLQSGQGTELIQDIKEMLDKSIKIVMISGVIPGKTLSRYIEAGDCDFLPKPISHKDIENKINSVKEKIIYGRKQNILMKLFTPPSDSIQRLKFLVSLNKARDYEFFLYIASALSSKESLFLTFTLKNKTHKITCDKGSIVNYESENPEHFLNKLISFNLIDASEKNQIHGKTQEDYINSLLDQCLLSSAQIIEAKYNMFVETLKEIVPEVDVSFTTHLTANSNLYPLLDQNEYANVLYPFLKQKFNKYHFPLFNDEIMEQDLIFKDNKKETNLPKDIQDLMFELQSGKSLKSIYEKHINNDNPFYIFLSYIFLKGNVYFAPSHFNINHYLYERYRNLDNFIDKTSPKKFFSLAAGTPISSTEEIKESYRSFIQHNHPDKIGATMPKDFIDLVTKVYNKIQHMCQKLTNINIHDQEEKRKKRRSLQREMLIAEKKKICERYLSNKQYKEAFSLINSISSNIINENIHYQLFYLWLHFENTNIKTNLHKVHEYMKNIQSINKDLHKETLYHYVLGLYHENKKNYNQAKQCFENARLVEPSFQPCYPAINRCSLIILKEEQSKKTFFSKAISYVKRKIEKKGA